MYEVDVIRGLKKLLSVGVIALKEGDSATVKPAGDEQAARQIDNALDSLTDELQALSSTDRQGR
jgi:hypothetical protein